MFLDIVYASRGLTRKSWKTITAVILRTWWPRSSWTRTRSSSHPLRRLSSSSTRPLLLRKPLQLLASMTMTTTKRHWQRQLLARLQWSIRRQALHDIKENNVPNTYFYTELTWYINSTAVTNTFLFRARYGASIVCRTCYSVLFSRLHDESTGWMKIGDDCCRYRKHWGHF